MEQPISFKTEPVQNASTRILEKPGFKISGIVQNDNSMTNYYHYTFPHNIYTQNSNYISGNDHKD